MKLAIYSNISKIQSIIILAVFILAGIAYASLLKNYHGQSGILPFYYQHIDFFENGFQRLNSVTPSFPLWGYSLVLYVFPDFISRELFQALIHSVVLFSIFIYFKGFLDYRFSRILFLILLLTPGGFSAAPPSQPYSLYSDCMLISLIMLANKRIVMSSLFFGLALNFRSETYILPPFIAVVAVMAKAFDWKIAIKWLALIYICMIPWAGYTYYNEGVPRFTSSNGGHVLIVGLGDLPDNKWGATGRDDDPLMRKLLKKNAAEGVSTLSSRGDSILKKEYIDLISSAPFEFWRKIKWQFKRVVWYEPSWPGILWLSDECLAVHCEQGQSEFNKLKSNNSYFAFLVNSTQYFTDLNRRITVLGYLGAPLIFLFGFLKKKPVFYLFNIWVLYSLTLFLLGQFISTYSANLFPILVFNLSLIASITVKLLCKPAKMIFHGQKSVTVEFGIIMLIISLIFL